MYPHSVAFLFVLLPLTVWAYYAIGSRSLQTRLLILLLASCVYYGWKNPLPLGILFASIGFNFFIGHRLSDLAAAGRKTRDLLWLGVGGNLTLLGYFKYTHFLFSVWNDMTGVSYAFQAFLLPVGISFYTFTQIMYLLDASNGLAERYSFLSYAAYVAFFPSVLSGPMAKAREVIPQFSSERASRFHWDDLSVGLTLLGLGLFKKAFLADSLADYATPVFSAAAHPPSLSFFVAWFGALAYTAQLYFDFSGYSDMAIGAARMLGVRLPANFNSPFKATSIIDFWGRWHMTLTRFLTQYVYNPLVLMIVRRRMQEGKAVIQRGQGTPGAFFAAVAIPTLFTMFVSGVWHGAGWTFIIFGLLHGVYLVLNHAWNMLRRAFWPRPPQPSAMGVGIGRAMTFIGVVVTFVFFRADSVGTAWQMLRGMFFLNGVSLSRSVPDHFPSLAAFLSRHGVVFEGFTLTLLFPTLIWIGAAYFIIWCLPNSLLWLARYKPALEPLSGEKERFWDWKPTPFWAVSAGLVTMLALWAVIGISRPTAFLYFKF